jgi:hypothetical protein|tara:strand:+ start:118 stop:1062 length:945 start_codon:yes stop_codon:yes gene_type:complete
MPYGKCRCDDALVIFNHSDPERTMEIAAQVWRGNDFEFPPVIEGVGSWKGEREPVFVSSFATFAQHFYQRCVDDGQDVYLLLGQAERRDLRPASLVPLCDHEGYEKLGLFGSCPEAYALTRPSWTLVSGRYFTTFASVEAYDAAQNVVSRDTRKRYILTYQNDARIKWCARRDTPAWIYLETAAGLADGWSAYGDPVIFTAAEKAAMSTPWNGSWYEVSRDTAPSVGLVEQATIAPCGRHASGAEGHHTSRSFASPCPDVASGNGWEKAQYRVTCLGDDGRRTGATTRRFPSHFDALAYSATIAQCREPHVVIA